MRKFGILFILLFFISGWSFAQKSTVDETEVEINGMKRIGQRISIQLDSKVIDKAWSSFLKEKAGKVTSSKGVYTVERAQIDTIYKSPLRIISRVDATPEGTFVWWSLDLGNQYMSRETSPEQFAAAEGVLREFARKMYREDILKQINDAEKVLSNALNEEQRVIRTASDIQRSIEKNRQRKLELEAELQRNAEELVQLNRDVENNLKQQEAAKVQVENMRKSVEVVKDKMHKLN